MFRLTMHGAMESVHGAMETMHSAMETKYVAMETILLVTHIRTFMHAVQHS